MASLPPETDSRIIGSGWPVGDFEFPEGNPPVINRCSQFQGIQHLPDGFLVLEPAGIGKAVQVIPGKGNLHVIPSFEPFYELRESNVPEYEFPVFPGYFRFDIGSRNPVGALFAVVSQVIAWLHVDFFVGTGKLQTDAALGQGSTAEWIIAVSTYIEGGTGHLYGKIIGMDNEWCTGV